MASADMELINFILKYSLSNREWFIGLSTIIYTADIMNALWFHYESPCMPNCQDPGQSGPRTHALLYWVLYCLTPKQQLCFFMKMQFYFVMFPIDVIFECGLIWYIFSQHCGYWWPGVWAPEQQELQCSVRTHAFPPLYGLSSPLYSIANESHQNNSHIRKYLCQGNTEEDFSVWIFVTWHQVILFNHSQRTIFVSKQYGEFCIAWL